MAVASGSRLADKRPESVLIIVHSTEGRVLLLKRHDPGDYWQSVTGSLKPGEDAYEAALREFTEETGLEPDAGLKDRQRSYCFPIHPAWRSRYAADISFNTEHVFTARVAEQPIRLNSREHSDYAWLPAAAAAEKVSSSTNREAILAYVPEQSETQ